jgi:hypothetical protein
MLYLACWRARTTAYPYISSVLTPRGSHVSASEEREERERDREGGGGGEGEVLGLLTSRRRSHESAMVCTSFKSTGAMPACGASAQRTAGERERESARTRACCCCCCCCCCCGCRARIACAIGEALSCADACVDEGDAMTLFAADAGADDAGEHAGASGTACAYTPAYVRMRQRMLHSIFMCRA